MMLTRWLGLLGPLLAMTLTLPAMVAAQDVAAEPAAMLRAIANRPAGDPQRQALRAVTPLAVAASKRIEDARTPRAGEAPAPVHITENLVLIGYPLAWVVEEVVFLYGDAHLSDLVTRVVFLYGQSIRDLLRDAIREGARRRAVARAEVLRKVAAADDGAAVLAALSAEDNVALAMEPINWQLIGLIEEQADLHLLQPNDDPGGALSAQ